MSKLPPLDRHGQIRVAKTYAKIIGPLREEARQLGYALAVHGSIKRDIDIVAVPWTRKACAPGHLAEKLRQVTERICGFAPFGSNGPWLRKKPHGRRCWTIHIAGTYVDLSVTPRSTCHG